MAKRWGLVLLCVCVASLVGNVYLYLELKPKSATTSAPGPAPSPPPADQPFVRKARAPKVQTVERLPQNEAPTPGVETRPVKTPEECLRMRLEANRAELRDPAQRQQAKENYVASTRLQVESEGGLEELHLSEEQLKRLYALAAEWFVQSAEAYPPPRSNWPLDQNPLIAGEFGTEVAQKWGKYQRESDGRYRVRDLAGRMASEDVPLTADQRRQLIELYTALEEERAAEVRERGIQAPTNEAEAIEMHEGTRERDVQYRQKLMDGAGSILSAKQMEVLRRDSEHRAAGMEREWEFARSQGQLVQKDANGCVRGYQP